ncbi:hypothetical protein MKW94_026517, partial [Papaver nudicaule]|nr:hypothetical protein [Papaver nudicaule]
FNVETVEYRNISFTVWDVGGQDKVDTFDALCNTTLFLHVPSGFAFFFLLDELRDAALLIFANKQDLPNTMNAAEITDELGLYSLHQRHWYIQSTCATSGEGLYEGLDWLSNNIPDKVSIKRSRVQVT